MTTTLHHVPRGENVPTSKPTVLVDGQSSAGAFEVPTSPRKSSIYVGLYNRLHDLSRDLEVLNKFLRFSLTIYDGKLDSVDMISLAED